MSAYGSGTDAYRDCTKWLTAFAPIAAVVAGATALVPRFVLLAGVADDPVDFVTQNWPALGGVAALGIGVLLIVWAGGSVLSTQPTDFGDLVSETDRLSRAFAAGVGAPYFLDSTTFAESLRNLHVIWDQGEAVDAADPILTRTVGVVEALREWSIHDSLRSRYRCFVVKFGIGAALMLAGGLVATYATASGSAAISKPTKVTVETNREGRADLLEATGCSDPDASEFWAIGGDWSLPELQVTGPDCRFGVTWHPAEGTARIRP